MEQVQDSLIANAINGLLRESDEDVTEQGLRAIYDTITCGIVVWNTVGQIIELNKAAQYILDMSRDALQEHVLTNPCNVFTLPDGTRLLPENCPYIVALRTGRAQHNVLEGFTRLDGQQRWLQVDAVPLFGKDGSITRVVISFIDVTERIKSERAARESERRFRALTEHASDLILLLDAVGVYRYASPSHKRILGYDPAELLNTSVFTLVHPDDMAYAIAQFSKTLQKPGEIVHTECRLHHANGTWVVIDCVGRNCLDDPEIAGLIANARDITERTAMEQVLRHQMLHDALTGLPNRTLLLDQLEQAVLAATSTEDKESIALLMMDLDRFKEINETFGHHYGDVLLQQIGVRLCQSVNTAGTVARLGGDEFAVLLPATNEAAARRAADAIRYALEEPFTIEGFTLQVEASIGAAFYPVHGNDSLTLLRRADGAMYRAKQMHEKYAVYDTAHNEQSSSRRLLLVGSLRSAIANNELQLYYQPQARINNGTVSSAEALLRWQHPTLGFVPPDQFIPLAEQTGLITPLTSWVLENALRQCRHWQQAGITLSVAVNLSMWNLREPALVDTIIALLHKHNVPPRLLCIELTEGTMMTDAEYTLHVLQRLFDLGVRISVDDFGTGYSSLAYLKRLPIDELKIDRSFVQHMAGMRVDSTIVRSMIGLAHSLGVRVVAEGVEDQPTWKLLADFGCDLGQGYFLSRPVPAQDFESWLKEQKQVSVQQ